MIKTKIEISEKVLNDTLSCFTTALEHDIKNMNDDDKTEMIETALKDFVASYIL